MIEKKTNYSFLLKTGGTLNFQKIKAVSDQFILNLSKGLQEKLFEKITPNLQVLDSEPLMAADLYINGEAHEAWLQNAFSYFPKSFLNKEIEIIDYRCGQGIAEIVYHDFLQTKNISQKIRRITLIDPSEIAIKRACLHTKLVFPDVEIRVACNDLDNLKATDILSEKKLTKLHLLMDVPDLNIETLVHLSKIIKANLSGRNYFLCINSYHENSPELLLEKLTIFIEMMNPDRILKYSKGLGVNQLISGKLRTASFRTFIKDGAKDGEIITEKEMRYRITGDGIKYSEDKTILIKCPYSIEDEYILPDTITSIDPKAFRGCDKVSAIIADNFNFISIDGVLYSRDMRRLIKYPQAKAGTYFETPESVQIIEPYAFTGCGLLEEIILPNTLSILGFGAFEYCIQLKNIIIPASVIRIEGRVFAVCKSLSTVDFNSICCESMENIETDSEGVSCSEALAFEGCTSLTTIRIGENVTMIPDFAFSFCEYITSIILPESVVYIGRNSFSYCKQLEKIILTKSVTTIGKDAFFWCENLRTILIPAGTSLYFNKFIALKDFASCIEEEKLEVNELLVSSSDADTVKGVVEIIENRVPEKEMPNTANEENRFTIICKEEDSSPAGSKKIERTVEPASEMTEFNDYVLNLHKLANQGNVKIQNKLGYMYEKGEKVIQNSAEAIKWYQMAANHGYAKAQFNLANQYVLGQGIEKNESEAVKWYYKAANQGIIDAMNNLGTMYAMGYGVEKDEVKAIEWYRKAAEKGNKAAIRNLQKRGIEI